MIKVIPRRDARLGSERVRALVVLIVLVVAATAVVVNTLARDNQRSAVADDGCRPGAPRADIALPAGPGDVRIKVLNGTERAGLADNVSTEFASRGFAVEKPGQSRSSVDRIAIIRYGPRTVGDAQFIMAHFLGEAEPKYDRERADGVVEVVIGAKYRQLATTTEVKQSLTVLGEAKVPPGACLVPPASPAQTTHPLAPSDGPRPPPEHRQLPAPFDGRAAYLAEQVHGDLAQGAGPRSAMDMASIV